VRAWLGMICLSFAIGTGGQNDAADSVPGPATGPLELMPARLDFGSQPAGTKSQAKTATLTNNSSQNVSIRDITASGIDFSETDTCQGVLAAGARCTIDVTFTPAITGPRLGTVLVTTDSPSPFFLVLMGRGE
jgi:hypothetical protein